MVSRKSASLPRLAGEGVFLVSFAHRDSLAAELSALGCRIVAARRMARLEARVIESGASVVVVDLNDAEGEGLAAIRALAPVIEARGLALVALYARRRNALAAQLVDSGATMLLATPYSAAELAAHIALAGKSVRRTHGLPAPLAAQPEREARDSLTGSADAAAVRHWINARMATEPVALLALGLTRFDMINSAFGRQAGDAALRAIAHRIEPLVADLRGVEILFARLRGAEFVVAVAGTISPGRLRLLAESIVEAVARPFAIDGETVRIGCRIGIATSEARDRSATSLLRRAHTAQTEGRGEGGPIRFLLGEAASAAELTSTLQSDLRAALTRDQIDILFQPQAAIATGRIEGVEALARWHHPRHGEIGAATLFAVAEQSDFTAELSAHVQRRALTMAAQWPSALDHLRLSVNVTAADMARPRFARSFLGLVNETGFPRERLTVEITESGLMADLDHAARVLGQLRTAGCRVAIDDFGTGYSSLAYLNALPADYIKLDKGLADDISVSARASIVVSGIIGMARSLGLTVIAEGVETEGNLALLAREGCSLYQGYLCARPLDSAALAALVG